MWTETTRAKYERQEQRYASDVTDGEVIRRSAEVTGFAVLPRRWVVERTLAWLNRNRRLAKDFETSLASAKT